MYLMMITSWVYVITVIQNIFVGRGMDNIPHKKIKNGKAIDNTDAYTTWLMIMIRKQR